MAKEPILTETEIAEGLQALSGWQAEEGKTIVKKYLFPSFPEAITFVNKVADIAERLNHHPFISIDYRRVTLRLTTWHSGGLTRLDMESAKAYDE
ncbi:4a-hydroxytetrahydrobiopterin dehydratase [Cohnella pontilimi]|uniref:4a-hydroxytetrahydrobiopterin dehydratase n=1 Tax=Cohnella pontilimi TaxID=2564100 RepID=A0A4U0F322_9BACL|nr:4a-hydroxytetrahydrobiopterin dehydratase [Cohnella pontilimi]TJY38947.1 4a-hydroxytetrahydrobiopterin dehydratase [Cohnella pontilimi]